MNTYYIKIVADEHYQHVECGGNTPALLEDAIKAAVKEFYKEGQPLPEVDLEKEVDSFYRHERCVGDLDYDDFRAIAEHFYELGKEGKR